MRIAGDYLLEGRPGLLVVTQVFLVNLANGEHRSGAMRAAGVFAAQELILRNGVAQKLVVIEGATAFGEQFGHGHHADIGLAAVGRRVIDAAVGVSHALVFAAGAVLLRESVELLAHAPGALELRAGLFSPGLNV